MQIFEVEKQELNFIESLLREFYMDSDLFGIKKDEYDKNSVMKTLLFYFNDQNYILKKVVEDDKIIGLFIIAIIPNFLNFNHKACVEVLVRPVPNLNKIKKSRVMIKMFSEIEKIAKEKKCKQIQMFLERNNQCCDYLAKKGYNYNEIVMIRRF